MNKAEILGFDWSESAVPSNVPAHSKERAAFRFFKMLPEVVWDASMLAGNPFTYPEVKTITDGFTVDGHNVADQEHVVNLFASSKRLLELVRSNRFDLELSTADSLHALLSRSSTPMITQPEANNLRGKYLAGKAAIETIKNPLERGLSVLLFGVLHQFYSAGNKNTWHLMMNGVLMLEGIDAISVPAARAEEFKARIADFLRHKRGDEMMAFLVSCHPEWAPQSAAQAHGART